MTSEPDNAVNLENHRQRPLDFFGAGDPLGSWLPDETIFSLSSRYHLTTGNYYPATTCKALFGHARAGAAHDLPSNVDEFAARTRGRLGNAVEIIERRTILPYFLAFKSPRVSLDAYTAMRGGGIAHLKIRLGLAASRFRCHLPLKACRDCIRTDTARFQIAYWHRRHQFPGVWLCPAHGTPLWECDEKVNGGQRFAWTLPQEDNLKPRFDDLRLGEPARASLMTLANAAISLGERDATFYIDLDRLGVCHRQQLARTHLASLTGRMKSSAIADSYFDFVAELAAVPELGELPRTTAGASAQIMRLLYRPGDDAHPLRELLLIVWLYGSWPQFVERYQACTQIPEHQQDLDFNGPQAKQDPRKQLVVIAARDEGRSATSLARTLGVDVSTVMAWLAQEGIASQRRPQRSHDCSRKQMIEALASGADVDSVVANAGVSATTVNRLLRTEVGLRNKWLEARHSATLKRNRGIWSALLKSNRFTPVTSLRAIHPAAYAWLYRNDKIWLQETVSARQTPKVASPSRVAWDTRDSSLAYLIRQTALALSAATSGGRVTVVSLCRALPDLMPKLRQLDRLPRTALVLADLGRHQRRKSKNA